MAKKCILTTHAGSLPRPAKLVELYAARAGGATIDEAVLIREGEAATRWVVDRQREAGVDIPSDGEQLREAFFLYVQRQMTGFLENGNDHTGTSWPHIRNTPTCAAVRLLTAHR